MIQRHVPPNYKAVTTQMTEEIFVSTFIIGKRTAAARGKNIAIKKRVMSAEGVRGRMCIPVTLNIS